MEIINPNTFHPDLPVGKMSMKRDSMQGNTLYSGLQTVAEVLDLITGLLLHYPDLQQRIIHGSSKSNPFATSLHLICMMVPSRLTCLGTPGHLYIPCSVSNSLENRIMPLVPNIFQGI